MNLQSLAAANVDRNPTIDHSCVGLISRHGDVESQPELRISAPRREMAVLTGPMVRSVQRVPCRAATRHGPSACLSPRHSFHAPCDPRSGAVGRGSRDRRQDRRAPTLPHLAHLHLSVSSRLATPLRRCAVLARSCSPRPRHRVRPPAPLPRIALAPSLTSRLSVDVPVV